MRSNFGTVRVVRGVSSAVMAWRATGLALGLIFAVTAQAAAPEVPGADQIVTRTLPNGMKLVVWPDKDIPNVAMYTWYASAAATSGRASRASRTSSST